ncbi:hypothetical protein B0H14DRAFT_2596854 [Mycena olivaceomarginata]|nr:hypothetical protein B0H14DRAFT_2596854 [Mycena olivaceomarginata]
MADGARHARSAGDGLLLVGRRQEGVRPLTTQTARIARTVAEEATHAHQYTRAKAVWGWYRPTVLCRQREFVRAGAATLEVFSERGRAKSCGTRVQEILVGVPLDKKGTKGLSGQVFEGWRSKGEDIHGGRAFYIRWTLTVLPTYTPTGSVPTLTFVTPAPTAVVTPTVSLGNGWADASDMALAITALAGCAYPDAWAGLTLQAPAALCTGA